MAKETIQRVTDTARIRALVGALDQALPVLERLAALSRDLLSGLKNKQGCLPCRTCEKKLTCRGACNDLKHFVPGIHQGRSSRENLTGLYPDTLYEVRDRRRFDVFAQYEACREVFTSAQWEVIYLYWNQGLTQAEIAESLGLERSAVSGRLARAKLRKQQHDRRMRQERLEHLKKMQEESSD